MAISLNTVNTTVTNHETRIKALESKVSTAVYTTGTGTNGRWFKFSNGLIIQCGKSGSGSKAFPIAFPSACAGFVTAGTNPTSHYSTTAFNFNDMNYGTSSKPGSVPWLAIGYLISDRILNYIYKAFAIIFTLIFSIRLVSKFTV